MRPRIVLRPRGGQTHPGKPVRLRAPGSRSGRLAPTRLRQADAIGEAVSAIAARPVRAAATSLGILLAVAWFVAALGLVSTANGQVSAAFAQRLATQLRVVEIGNGPVPAAYPFPADVGRRLGALNGVVAAGVYWPVRLAGPVMTAARRAPGGQPSAGVRAARPAVIAATPGFLSAAGVLVRQGRRYGAWAQAHAAQVCLLGSAAARALGITGLRGGPAVVIGNETCAVIGIVWRAVRQPALLRSVLMPTTTATALFGPTSGRSEQGPAVLIQVRPGAALVVARQARYAISPARPGRFRVIVPRRPQGLRDQVTRTLDGLFVVAGLVSLAAGVLSLANVSWMSVQERSAEFALRRAVGARRRHVALHVVWETAILGLTGGLAGASLGVAIVVLVARARHWEPVVAPLTALPAPLAGAAAGVLAGLLPAIRAARIRPGWSA